MTADHPHGDGRTECYLCGKFVHEVTHSCKGVPVTRQAEARVRALIAEVRADERRRCVEAIERRRNEHWQCRKTRGKWDKSDPYDYGKHDAYRDAANAVSGLGGEEVAGGEVQPTPTPTETGGETVDLLSALQRSVEAARSARAEEVEGR